MRKRSVSRHTANETLASHRHSHGYVAFVLSGTYREFSADGVWECEPGDVIIHPCFHQHKNGFGKTGVEVLNIPIEFEMAGQSALQQYSVVRPETPDDFVKVASDSRALCEVLNTSTICEKSAASDWLDLFAADLVENIDTRIGNLACSYEVSAAHLSRAFKARFGVSPQQLRMERRFRTAITLLQTSDLSFADLALQAGYADQSHFSRHVKTITRISPARLRQCFRQHQIHSRQPARTR